MRSRSDSPRKDLRGNSTRNPSPSTLMKMEFKANTSSVNKSKKEALHVVKVQVLGLAGIRVARSQCRDGSKASHAPMPPNQAHAVVGFTHGDESHGVTAFSKALKRSPTSQVLIRAGRTAGDDDVTVSSLDSKNQPMPQRHLAVWSGDDSKSAITFETKLHRLDGGTHSLASKTLARKNFELLVGLAEKGAQSAIALGAANLSISSELVDSSSITVDLPIHPLAPESLAEIPISPQKTEHVKKRSGGLLRLRKKKESSRPAISDAERKAFRAVYAIDPTGDAVIRVRVDVKLKQGAAGDEPLSQGNSMSSSKRLDPVSSHGSEQDMKSSQPRLLVEIDRDGEPGGPVDMDDFVLEPSIERTLSDTERVNQKVMTQSLNQSIAVRDERSSPALSRNKNSNAKRSITPSDSFSTKMHGAHVKPAAHKGNSQIGLPVVRSHSVGRKKQVDQQPSDLRPLNVTHTQLVADSGNPSQNNIPLKRTESRQRDSEHVNPDSNSSPKRIQSAPVPSSPLVPTRSSISKRLGASPLQNKEETGDTGKVKDLSSTSRNVNDPVNVLITPPRSNRSMDNTKSDLDDMLNSDDSSDSSDPSSDESSIFTEEVSMALSREQGPAQAKLPFNLKLFTFCGTFGDTFNRTIDKLAQDDDDDEYTADGSSWYNYDERTQRSKGSKDTAQISWVQQPREAFIGELTGLCYQRAGSIPAEDEISRVDMPEDILADPLCNPDESTSIGTEGSLERRKLRWKRNFKRQIERFGEDEDAVRSIFSIETPTSIEAEGGDSDFFQNKRDPAPGLSDDYLNVAAKEQSSERSLAKNMQKLKSELVNVDRVMMARAVSASPAPTDEISARNAPEMVSNLMNKSKIVADNSPKSVMQLNELTPKPQDSSFFERTFGNVLCGSISTDRMIDENANTSSEIPRVLFPGDDNSVGELTATTYEMRVDIEDFKKKIKERATQTSSNQRLHINNHTLIERESNDRSRSSVPATGKSKKLTPTVGGEVAGRQENYFAEYSDPGLMSPEMKAAEEAAWFKRKAEIAVGRVRAIPRPRSSVGGHPSEGPHVLTDCMEV